MGGTTMGVKLDDDTRERLERVAEMKQRSVHWLMKDAIGRYLAHGSSVLAAFHEKSLDLRQGL